jgi:predicted RNase H-like HicB family nuclease
MNKPYYVHAEWDDKAQVWTASSDDVPGLATEADTTESLVHNQIAFELLTRRFELAA